MLLATLLRRHFAAVHLVLLALAALLAARAIGTLGALLLFEGRPVRSSSTSEQAPALPAAAERAFDAALGAALFDLAPRTDDAGALATSCEDAPDSALPLRLVGTAVFAEPSQSLASIVTDERRGGVAEVYGPGELIGERARLVVVAVEHVCVENLLRGGLERVGTLGPATPAAPPAASAAPATQPTASLTGDHLLDELVSGARATPRFSGGKLSGVRLAAIKPGSLYARAGLHNGDVVVAIDGATPGSLDAALALLARLRTQATVELSVERKGAPLTLTVEVPQP